MSVFDDITRLGLHLTDDDDREIKEIINHIRNTTHDEIVKNTLIELHVIEYLSIMRPDIMSALIKEKERENNEWIKRTQRTFDENGNRICQEAFCDSINEVSQCRFCGKYVCKYHNYSHEFTCCYDCWEKVSRTQ